jgi:hypothetical protein
MGSNDLPVKKIYIDSKFRRRDSVNSSNFKIELPYTLKMSDNTIFYIDDVSIPNSWYTVEDGVNDKLYVRVVNSSAIVADHTLTLTSQNYNGTQLASEISTKLTASSAGTHSCTFDPQTQKISLSFTNQKVRLFTDSELKAGGISWVGTAYNGNDLSSANELLNNTTTSTLSALGVAASFYLTLQPVRNIYMRSPNLSTFTTIGCNGESSIIKKIPVNANYGDMIFNNITSANDFLDCSRATWKTLEFHLLDVNSNYINLHGSNVSFSIVLDKRNPNQ